MSDLKLFRIEAGRATELLGQSVALERSLQRVIETNLETLFESGSWPASTPQACATAGVWTPSGWTRTTAR